MGTVGADLRTVEPGEVVIEAPITTAVGQQHGYAHAGFVIGLTDTACGYSAVSLTDPGMDVVTVELKVNLLAPSVGTSLRAVGRVVRSGRTLSVCQGDAYAIDGDTERHVATMLATMAPRPIEAPAGDGPRDSGEPR